MFRLALEMAAPWSTAPRWSSARSSSRRQGRRPPGAPFPGPCSPPTAPRPRCADSSRRRATRRMAGGAAPTGARAKASGSLPRAARDDPQAHKRKVSLIGWSLGGIYAREFAKEMPRAVRVVITLGTPFTGHPKATNAWRLYEKVTATGSARGTARALRVPPPVPTTSIFSRSDGIVAWQCSIEKPARCTRTSRWRRATWVSVSIRSRGTRSPTAWRSPKASGSLRSRRGARVALPRPEASRLVLGQRRCDRSANGFPLPTS